MYLLCCISMCAVLLCGHTAALLSTPLDSTLSAALQRSLDSCVAAYNLPGLSVAVRLPDGRSWNGVAGYNRPPDQEPMDTTLLFRQASVTKMYVAATVLQMAEEGLLSVDDSLGRYVGPFPHIDGSIRIRSLLNHRSGLFDMVAGDPSFGAMWYTYPDSLWTPQDLLATFMQPPYFPEGTSFRYSNTNYYLLGLIVETVAGRPFNEELRRRFLEPHGLNNTFFPYRDSIAGREVTGWGQSNQQVQVYDLDLRFLFSRCSASMVFTAGTLVATPSDVADFTRLLWSGHLLSSESLDLMMQCSNVNMGHGCNGYGYGSMRFIFSGLRYFGHAGDVGGFTQIAVHGIDDGITLVASVNRHLAPRGLIAQAVLRALYTTVGITEAPAAPVVSLAPNPASERVLVLWAHGAPAGTALELCDALGRVHVRTAVDAGSTATAVDLRGVAPGVYVMRVYGGAVPVVLPVVIR